jgi:hypothetical protein
MFGFLQEEGGYGSALRQVTLQITSDSSCNSTYVDYGGITDSMICAGDSNGSKGACAVKGHDKYKYLYVNISHLLQTLKSLFH